MGFIGLRSNRSILGRAHYYLGVQNIHLYLIMINEQCVI
jgi:hypothetical protein